MSLEAMVWAVNTPRVTTTADYAMLSVLAEFASSDMEWIAWPSNERIGWHARMTPRNVRLRLRKLEELGVIEPGPPGIAEHIPERYRPNVWRLLPTETELERGPDTLSARWQRERRAVHAAQSGGKPRPPSATPGGKSQTARGEESDTTGGKSLPPNQSCRTSQRTKSDAAAASEPLFGLPEPRPAKPDVAKKLAASWWESQDPRPMGNGAWHALVKVCTAALERDWTPDAINAALYRIGTVPSTTQLDRELRNPRKPQPSARRQSLEDAGRLIRDLQGPEQTGQLMWPKRDRGDEA